MKVIASRNKREGGYYGKFWGKYHRVGGLFNWMGRYVLEKGWRHP